MIALAIATSPPGLLFGGPTISPVFAVIGIPVVLAVVEFGMMLLARTLNADWGYSFGAAALASVLFLVIVPLMFAVGAELPLALLVVTGMPGMIAVVAVLSEKRIILTVAASTAVLYATSVLLAFSLPNSGIISACWIIAAASWLILPAIAGALLSD